MFQPSPPASDTEQAFNVTNALRQHILDGTLKAGLKLREAELATHFGVSRTPVRQALAAIEREGLVVYEPYKGFTVRTFGLNDLQCAYEMRALLEGYACRSIAERGLPGDMERRLINSVESVDALLAGDSEVLRSEDHAVWKRTNAEFHHTLLHQVSNPFLDRLLATVQQIPLVQNGLAVPRKAELLRLYNVQHREILQAILNRQGVRAEFLMREHVHHAFEEISSQIES